MDAELITEIIKSEIMTADKSSLHGCCLFDGRVLLMAIRDAAYEITTELEDADESKSKPEPSEPPKTVLPDIRGLKDGQYYAFLTSTGDPMLVFDNRWFFHGVWMYGYELIRDYPHLGRLRRAVPGEVAE